MTLSPTDLDRLEARADARGCNWGCIAAIIGCAAFWGLVLLLVGRVL